MAFSVEKPPHVHATRMRDIDERDLLFGLGHAGCSIGQVRRSLVERLRAAPPVWDLRVAATQASRAARAQHIEAAEQVVRRHVDFLSSSAGRSGLYGLHYLTWLEPVVLAHLHTGDPRYGQAFARHFRDWFASRNDVVGEWHGLDVVWYSLGVWARARLLVQALAAFGEEPTVSDETIADVLATLLGGARWAAEEHDEFRPGNWQLVCAAELLHVASVLPDAPENGDWVGVGHARTLDHLDQDFTSDGGHRERSPGYHSMCLDALQRAAVVSGRDFGLPLATHPMFARAHHWLAAMTTPGGWVPPWQDSTVVWPAEMLARGHALWGESVVPASVPTEDSILAESGYGVLRGREPANAYLAVNAGAHIGHELESHSHLAVADFVVAADDQPLALEAGGPPTYDDPTYQSWFRAPLAHNMLTIDGVKVSESRAVHLEVDQPARSVRRMRVVHDAFGDAVTRSIYFVDADPCYWVIVDQLTVARPWTWSILAPAPWERSTTGFCSGHPRSLVVVPVDRALRHELDTGPGLVPTSGGGSYGTLHALRLHGESAEVAVLLAPDAHDQVSAWSIDRRSAGWRVSSGRTVDHLGADTWERRSAMGAR
jgi:hypothetical protein